MCWATFWAIFPQAHLVNLTGINVVIFFKSPKNLEKKLEFLTQNTPS
jgi:hypothetical protein